MRDVPALRSDPLLLWTTRAMVVVDVGFLVYWAVVALALLPPEAMYPEHTDPRVAAWNWSFLPLDVAASLTGLAAVRALRRGRPAAPLLTLSLALTATAGGMAVAYFALRGQFDPAWFGPNLALLLFPLPLLTRLTVAGRATRTRTVLS